MKYENPEMEVVKFMVMDILTVSGDGVHEEGSGDDVDFG